MSNIAIKGAATGTGVFTLESPATNTDRTLTLPDATGTVTTAEAVLAQFNATGTAPVYACRAWVNFQGTGTVAIRASGNVSSVTDVNVGAYTVNFTTSMPDANYSAEVAVQNTVSSDYGCVAVGGVSAGSLTVNSFQSNGTNADTSSVYVAIFR
jgi:hypothetical protein